MAEFLLFLCLSAAAFIVGGFVALVTGNSFIGYGIIATVLFWGIWWGCFRDDD